MRTDWQHAEALATARGNDPAPECDCCETNDYDPAPEDGEDEFAVPGSCLNCGHSPEEHGE
jgi:hypothetical protein